MRILDTLQIDKTQVEVNNIHCEKAPDNWIFKTPLERLEGLEVLRQMWSNYAPDTARLPRFYSIIKQTQR